MGELDLPHPPVEKKWIIPQDMMWDDLIKKEMQQSYMVDLQKYLSQQRAAKTIYPSGKDVLNAFKCTPFWMVNCIIIGQDPYHTPGDAHGLSFSTLSTSRPPSLRNIYEEIKNDCFPHDNLNDLFDNNNLTCWAKQGVLLLNRVLTVAEGEANSHQNKGWEQFTEAMIKELVFRRNYLVFMLWGKNAQELAPLIDTRRHLVLTASHPSPYSANQGFIGCKHFSKANKFIEEHHQKRIDWRNIQRYNN